MTTRIGVVTGRVPLWAKVSTEAGSQVTAVEAEDKYQRGDLVLFDDQSRDLESCPPELVERSIGRIALVKNGAVFVTRSTYQFEVVVPPNITVKPGDGVILANAFLVERVDNDAEDVLKGMGLQKDRTEFSLVGIRYKPEELANESAVFAGYAAARLEAQDFIVRALSESNVYDGTSVKPPRGMVILGPPGTGKTTLARQLAREAKATLYILRGPEVLSKWVGDSERNLKAIFADAKDNAPSIIFIDEIDSLTMARGESRQEHNRQLVATLLSLMDGFAGLRQIAVIGTTNRVEDVDPAFRRAGRLDHEILLGEPTEADRADILKALLGQRAPDEPLLRWLATQTPKWTGSDLYALCRGALDMAARDSRTQLWESDFLDGLKMADEHRARRKANG